MSQIVSSHFLVPGKNREPHGVSYPQYGDEYFLPKALTLPDDSALVDLPQPRAFRSLSRAGLMLNAVGLQARRFVAHQAASDPYSVGIYCAIENGPDDFRSATRMLDTRPGDFAATYKSLRSPKQHFRLLTNVPPSQLAIFLGVNGPLVVYNHSRFAAEQALEQAECDLASKKITSALVCSAFSLENPLIAMRTWLDAPQDAVLCEGAACIALAANGAFTQWDRLPRQAGNHYYGVADTMVRLAEAAASRPPGDWTGAHAGNSQGETAL